VSRLTALIPLPFGKIQIVRDAKDRETFLTDDADADARTPAETPPASDHKSTLTGLYIESIPDHLMILFS
jgi:hypothetical protein